MDNMYQTAEYLNSSQADNGNTGEEILLFTTRPDPQSLRPHNIGLSRNPAERLLRDLQRLLTVAPLLLLALIGTGCSAKVDVSTESRTPSETVEKSSTSVALDVLTDREEALQPMPLEATGKAVEIDGDGNTVVVVEGDLQICKHHDQPKAAGTRSRSGMHTKIGFPAQYRAAGIETYSCYLAVWGLVLATIALMIHNLNQAEGGPLLSIVAMLGVAALLLQFLPHAESGIQLVPFLPWAIAVR